MPPVAKKQRATADTPLVIGVDFGTESCRAGVFDAETGVALGFCSEAYPTTFPRPSHAEQDPAAWWRALRVAVRGAVAAARVDPSRIAALSVDTTCCTVVAFDRAHPERKPLRPAILWMDMRAREQAARVLATGDPAVVVNSNGQGPVSAEWFIPKALWIREHEPDVWGHPSCAIAEFQDWINLRLTGQYVASRNNVAVRWHWRAAPGSAASATSAEPPLSLLRALGVEGELRARWPGERVLELGARIGAGLTAEAAEHLGLSEGTIVAQGGADAFIGMLGLGVTKAGEMAMLTVSFFYFLGRGKGGARDEERRRAGRVRRRSRLL
jgi:ribulose kinase